jgi:hypothetical protein
MANNDIVRIGYYFWLIPSIISCFLSSLLLLAKLRELKTKKLIWVGVLELLFALADIVQCVPWFFGSIYSNKEDRTDGNFCSTQEAMFEAGALAKCLLSSIATATLAYFIFSKKRLHISTFLPPAMVLVFYTIVSLITNLALGGTEVACYNLHDLILGGRMKTIQWAYFFCFLLPVYGFSFINLMSYVLTVYCSFTENTSVVSSIMTPQYDRVTTFTLISWMPYVPILLFILLFLFRQVNIPLYCVTGRSVSSTGALGSGYLLLAPWIDKSRKTNLFFFTEKLLEENENEEDESSVMKFSEMSSVPHSSAPSGPSNSIKIDI